MTTRFAGEPVAGQTDLPFVRNIAAFLASQMKYALLVLSNPRAVRYEGLVVPIAKSLHLRERRRDLYKGLHERQEIETIKRLIRPDDVVVEFGAGCGLVTAVISKSLTDSRQLHTFEANASLRPTIEAVCAENKVAPNIHIAAVGLQDGETGFYVDDNVLSSSLLNESGPAKRMARRETVKMVSVPAILERLRPTFLVADVEGAESDILTVPFNEELRVICAEFHPPIIGDTRVSEIIAHIIDAGFDLIVDQSYGRAQIGRAHV